MTKNDISHFCPFSQNFQPLRSSFHVDSGEHLNRGACNCSDLSRHLKQFKMTKNDISQFCHFSQNFQLLRSSFHVDSGEHLNRGSCNCSDLSRHLKQVKMIKNNISHFCQFSQNLPVKVYSHHRQWNMPSHMSLSFLRPQPAFEVGENDKKMTFHNFVHFLKTFSY